MHDRLQVTEGKLTNSLSAWLVYSKKQKRLYLNDRDQNTGPRECRDTSNTRVHTSTDESNIRGCGVRGAGCGVRGAGCGVRGAGCGVRGAGCGVRGAGCGVRGAGCGVRGAGCRVRGAEC